MASLIEQLSTFKKIDYLKTTNDFSCITTDALSNPTDFFKAQRRPNDHICIRTNQNAFLNHKFWSRIFVCWKIYCPRSLSKTYF